MTVVLEIMPSSTRQVFRAMQALRTHLTDADEFVHQVDQVQRPAGYRLLGAFDHDRPGTDGYGGPSGRDNGTDAVAVLGFRFGTNLAWGRFCYVDDLSTLPGERGKGHATALLEKVHEIARDEGIEQVHLDSGVQAERAAAHGLYFARGFRIASYHFSRGI